LGLFTRPSILEKEGLNENKGEGLLLNEQIPNLAYSRKFARRKK
jgi:hypothetical protein